jgi:hypothetical protein
MVRALLASLILLAWISFFAQRPIDRGAQIVHAQASTPSTANHATNNRAGYVGNEACMPCHKDVALSYEATSHSLTSQLPRKDSILGSFKDGENFLMIENPPSIEEDPRLFFKMDIQHGDFYQTAVAEKGAQKLTRSEHIDIVTGAGVRGQTYLYWAGNELYELPVSYWSDGRQWINSPGYKDGTANFARHVDPRCLECHATYIQALSPDPQTNLFDKGTLVTGISCENCHGPGAAHVVRETDVRAAKAVEPGRAILNPAKFTRDRQVDLCALCHNGGQRNELAPAFTYRPGEALDRYFAPEPVDSTNQPDVHGNQVGLLKKSRCYQSSPAMSCSTCHNVHERERTTVEYSDRCLGCHRWQSCGVSRTLGSKIARNCIDCHMPMQQTTAIVSTTASRVLHTSIRSHWIKIYPGQKGG